MRRGRRSLWKCLAPPMLQLAADRSPLALCALCAAFFITGRWTAAVSPSLSRVDEPATGSPPAASLWPVYAASLDRARYIDLTHPIEPGMPLWPAFGAPSVGPALAARNVSGFIDAGQPFTYADHGFIASALGLPTDQLGTQLDPPAHWHERGATISDVPPTVALRPLAVIDLSDRPPGHHATRADVLAWEVRSQTPLENALPRGLRLTPGDTLKSSPRGGSLREGGW